MRFKSDLFLPVYFSLQLANIVYSQNSLDNFFDALIHDRESISSFVDNEELTRSGCLGINYTGIKYKFLISYDIDENIKKGIIEKKIESKTSNLEMDGEYSKVEFSAPSLNYIKYFYFKSGKFISPSTYYSRNWETDTSKYFVFRISEPKYFNKYCEKKLDEFVDKIGNMLEFSDGDKQLLEKQKIFYVLCRDEKEIKTVSGFDMRGQYLTAFDEILTTYNTHFHELCHFLINYKLKNLSLYTLPFFMEGFAVALGGRGGLDPRVVTDIGLYLQLKGFLTYDSIITNDAFYSEDASLTYPVAGLYNLFLQNTLGMGAYLDLYKKVNGNMDYLKDIDIKTLSLPSKNEFDRFISNYEKGNPVYLRNISPCGNNLEIDKEGALISDDTCFYFCARTNILYLYPLNEKYDIQYVSRNFENITKNKYNGETYLINVDSSYVKIYNCLNDELIISYDVNFSLNGQNVPYYFQLNKLQKGEPEEKIFYFGLRKPVLDVEVTINK